MLTSSGFDPSFSKFNFLRGPKRIPMQHKPDTLNQPLTYMLQRPQFPTPV